MYHAILYDVKYYCKKIVNIHYHIFINYKIMYLIEINTGYYSLLGFLDKTKKPYIFLLVSFIMHFIRSFEHGLELINIKFV